MSDILLPHEQQGIKALDQILFPSTHPYDFPLEEEEWETHFQSPSSNAWIIPNDGTTMVKKEDCPIIAAALTEPKLDENTLLRTLYLFWIGVHPHSTQRGIGHYLLDHVIEFAKWNDWKVIELDVNVNNTVAIAMYTRRGFVHVSRNHNYYKPTNPQQVFDPNVCYDGYTMRLMMDSL